MALDRTYVDATMWKVAGFEVYGEGTYEIVFHSTPWEFLITADVVKPPPGGLLPPTIPGPLRGVVRVPGTWEGKWREIDDFTIEISIGSLSLPNDDFRVVF